MRAGQPQPIHEVLGRCKTQRTDSEWLSQMKWPEEKSSGHFDFYPKPDTVWNWITDTVRQTAFF
jgi:hypothetical protein